MNLLLGVGAIIIVIGLILYWRVRTRPGRAHLYAPPHTPPTVPWHNAARGRDTESLRRGDER